MNSSRLFFAVTALAFLITLSFCPVKAGSLGNGAAQRQKLMVDSVDAAGGTVVIKSGVDNSVHTYKIAATTKLMVGHVKGSIDQVKSGMKVANLRAVAGAEPQTLDLLWVYQAAPATAAPVPAANQ
jgi:hypothetical protein